MQIQNKFLDVTDFKNRCTWYDFIWGKATTLDGVWQLMGRPESCKDYIMDTYHYTTDCDHLDRTLWTEEEVQSPHLYVYPKRKGAKFLKGIKEFLNPYEIKHGFTPTTVKKGAFAGKILYLITHDAKWCKTLIARSYYYSMLRICAYIDTTLPTNNTKELLKAIYGTSLPEYYYISRVKEEYFDIFYQDPTILLKGTYTGFPKEYSLSHGCTGLFWNTQLYEYKKACEAYAHRTVLDVVNQTLKEYDVKMQGV